MNEPVLKLCPSRKGVALLLPVAAVLWLIPARAAPPVTGGELSNSRSSTDHLWRQEGKDLTNALIRLYCVKTMVTLSWLGALLAKRRADWLRDALHSRLQQQWLADALFFATVTGAIHLLTSPLNYLDFIVQHAYGQNTRSPSSWLIGDALHFFVVALAVPALALLAYRIVRRLPNRWWWFLSLGVVPVNLLITVVGPIYADMTQEVRPMKNEPLRRSILDFAGAAGVTVENVYVEGAGDSGPQPRAFVTGLGPRKRIVLSHSLLTHFTAGEVLFVTAHEVGHYALGHLWIDVGVGIVAPIAVLYLLFLLGNQATQLHEEESQGRGREAATYSLRIRSTGDPVSFPFFVLIVVMLGVFAKPAKNTLSRYVEHAADRYALEHTVPQRIPVSVPVSLFQKIGAMALLDPQPNPIVKAIFFPHPPLDERIDYCKSWRRYTRHR